MSRQRKSAIFNQTEEWEIAKETIIDLMKHIKPNTRHYRLLSEELEGLERKIETSKFLDSKTPDTNGNPRGFLGFAPNSCPFR